MNILGSEGQNQKMERRKTTFQPINNYSLMGTLQPIGSQNNN